MSDYTESELERTVHLVPGAQLMPDGNTYLDGCESGSPRVLILGNSILWHRPKADIGWSGNWGMAASSRGKDFAHRLLAMLQAKWPRAEICAAQCANSWERSLGHVDYEQWFSAARSFRPDYVLFFAGANIPLDETFDRALMQREIGALLDYVTSENPACKRIISTGFYYNEVKHSVLQEYAVSIGTEPLEMYDLSQNDENLAVGLYEHAGVAHHPGDLGMERIARRFFDRILQLSEKQS